MCLQEGEGELPTRDLAKLFDNSLHAMDLALLPKCIRYAAGYSKKCKNHKFHVCSCRLHEQLNVKHEPLGLIQPQFEVPLPQMHPAVFKFLPLFYGRSKFACKNGNVLQVFLPNFRELPHPELELFDLDEMLASEKVRLAQITNKCMYPSLVQEEFLQISVDNRHF